MDTNMLAYMAGFIDADGYISIITVAALKRHTVKVAVTNTNYEIIKLFSNTFGGKIRTRKPKNKNWKICYEWSLASNKALEVIKMIYPYLQIKCRQAELCIELQKIREDKTIHARWKPVEFQLRRDQMDKLKEECLSLNERGTKNRHYKGDLSGT